MKKCTKMYEKNINLSKEPELLAFLELLADLNTEIELFAMGGTAMVLAGIKEATKDVDFLTTTEYHEMRDLLAKAGLKEKSKSMVCDIWMLNNLRIDIFYNAFIIGVDLPED